MEYWTERLGVHMRRGDEVKRFLWAISSASSSRPPSSTIRRSSSSTSLSRVSIHSPWPGYERSVAREGRERCDRRLFFPPARPRQYRLYDRVGIASLGKIAAEGTADHLRDSGSDTVIEIETPDAGCRPRRCGLRPFSMADAQVLQVRKLPAGMDDQEVLHAALSAGPVHGFSRVRLPDESFRQHSPSPRCTAC